MMATKFLAVDFGTTNCVAAQVSSDFKLDLVPFGDGKFELPSAIFLKTRVSQKKSFDDAVFEQKVEKEISDQKKNRDHQINLLEQRLQVFKDRFGPRLKNPNNIYTSSELKKHNYVSNKHFLAAVELFQSGRLQEERERLFSELLPLKSEEIIRKEVKSKMYHQMLQDDYELLKENTFFTAIADQEARRFIGADAINAYADDPSSGFFMRSPKAFLGVELLPIQRELFTEAICLILRHIKLKAEEHFSETFEGVVIGRPVNFMGANNDSLNEQAVSTIKNAATRAGFNLVRFVYEPLAASLPISQNIFSSDEDVLIIDVGGGTTDIAYLRTRRDEDIKLEVLGISGERIGGNDIDESIALNKFTTFFSKDILEARKIASNAFATRDMHRQAAFREAAESIYLLTKSNPDSPELSRLNELYRFQLQHQLLLHGELLKKNIGDSHISTEKIDCFSLSFEVELSAGDVFDICERHLSTICRNIGAALPDSYNQRPVRVFMTGGMSLFVPVIKAVKEFLPKGSTFKRIPALHSVCAGLAIVARQLNLNPFDEPKNVRGINVMR
jgi:hypothetical chaperone protein